MRFTDQHVIVTGGGTGIGRGIVHRFAREGARVVIANRNADNGQRVVEEIRDAGGTACFIQTDVSQEAEVNRLIDAASTQYGPVRVAVSNAATTESAASALDVTMQEWDQVFAVNTRGAFMFCRACAQHMIDHEVAGAIVTVGTLMARSGKGMSGAYAPSKAALLMFTKTLAKSVASMGIRVNCVSPGVVATDIYRAIEETMMMEAGGFAEWLVEESINSGQLLVPRAGTAEEIAAAVAFLASEEASYITAQNLSVDGGMDWCW